MKVSDMKVDDCLHECEQKEFDIYYIIWRQEDDGLYVTSVSLLLNGVQLEEKEVRSV